MTTRQRPSAAGVLDAPVNRKARKTIHTPEPNMNVMEVTITPTKAASIERRLLEVTAGNRFNPDVHASEMQCIAGEIIKDALPERDRLKLREFGSGKSAPILIVTGLPVQKDIPATPVHGFMPNQFAVAFSDMLLLGLYDVSGISPVAYQFENHGCLFRNVVPNPEATRSLSSHGSREPLGWHSDDSASRFEGERRSGGGGKAPIPRWLGFSPLRNRDANGEPVPTEVLPLSGILSDLGTTCLESLMRREFRINSPESNAKHLIDNVPIILRQDGQYYARFSETEGQVVGLTDRAKDALERFKSTLAAQTDEVLPFVLEPGRCLVFDNYRVFHKRRSFDMGTDWASARWLRRCFGCSASALHNGVRIDPLHSPNVLR